MAEVQDPPVKIKKTYDYLAGSSEKFRNTVTFDQFTQDMQDEEKRKKTFDYLQSNNPKFKSSGTTIDQFSSDMLEGVEPVKKKDDTELVSQESAEKLETAVAPAGNGSPQGYSRDASDARKAKADAAREQIRARTIKGTPLEAPQKTTESFLEKKDLFQPKPFITEHPTEESTHKAVSDIEQAEYEAQKQMKAGTSRKYVANRIDERDDSILSKISAGTIEPLITGSAQAFNNMFVAPIGGAGALVGMDDNYFLRLAAKTSENLQEDAAIEKGVWMGDKAQSEKAIYDLIGEGNYVDALQSTSYSILNSMPTTLGILASGGAGGLPATLAAGFASGYGSSIVEDQLRDRNIDGLDQVQGVIHGVVEGVTDVLFSGLNNQFAKAIGGQAISREAVKEGLMKPLLKFGKNAAGEGGQEMIQEVMGYATDVLFGDDVWSAEKAKKRGFDALIIGMGSGGTISALTYSSANAVTRQDPVNEQINSLSDEINTNEQLTPEAKKALSDQKNKLTEQANANFAEALSDVSTLDEADKLRLRTLDESITEIDQALKTTKSAETREMLRQTKEQHQSEIVSINEKSKQNPQAKTIDEAIESEPVVIDPETQITDAEIADDINAELGIVTEPKQETVKQALTDQSRVSFNNQEGYIIDQGKGKIALQTDDGAIIPIKAKKNQPLDQAKITRVDTKVSVNPEGTIEVYGNQFTLNTPEAPGSDVIRNDDGLVTSVTLRDQDGKPKEFKGRAAQEIADVIETVQQEEETALSDTQEEETDDTTPPATEEPAIPEEGEITLPGRPAYVPDSETPDSVTFNNANDLITAITAETSETKRLNLVNDNIDLITDTVIEQVTQQGITEVEAARMKQLVNQIKANAMGKMTDRKMAEAQALANLIVNDAKIKQVNRAKKDIKSNYKKGKVTQKEVDLLDKLLNVNPLELLRGKHTENGRVKNGHEQALFDAYHRSLTNIAGLLKRGRVTGDTIAQQHQVIKEIEKLRSDLTDLFNEQNKVNYFTQFVDGSIETAEQLIIKINDMIQSNLLNDYTITDIEGNVVRTDELDSEDITFINENFEEIASKADETALDLEVDVMEGFEGVPPESIQDLINDAEGILDEIEAEIDEVEFENEKEKREALVDEFVARLASQASEYGTTPEAIEANKKILLREAKKLQRRKMLTGMIGNFQRRSAGEVRDNFTGNARQREWVEFLLTVDPNKLDNFENYELVTLYDTLRALTTGLFVPPTLGSMYTKADAIVQARKIIADTTGWKALTTAKGDAVMSVYRNIKTAMRNTQDFVVKGIYDKKALAKKIYDTRSLNSLRFLGKQVEGFLKTHVVGELTSAVEEYNDKLNHFKGLLNNKEMAIKVSTKFRGKEYSRSQILAAIQMYGFYRQQVRNSDHNTVPTLQQIINDMKSNTSPEAKQFMELYDDFTTVSEKVVEFDQKGIVKLMGLAGAYKDSTNPEVMGMYNFLRHSYDNQQDMVNHNAIFSQGKPAPIYDEYWPMQIAKNDSKIPENFIVGLSQLSASKPSLKAGTSLARRNYRNKDGKAAKGMTAGISVDPSAGAAYVYGDQLLDYIVGDAAKRALTRLNAVVAISDNKTESLAEGLRTGLIIRLNAIVGQITPVGRSTSEKFFSSVETRIKKSLLTTLNRFGEVFANLSLFARHINKVFVEPPVTTKEFLEVALATGSSQIGRIRGGHAGLSEIQGEALPTTQGYFTEKLKEPGLSPTSRGAFRAAEKVTSSLNKGLDTVSKFLITAADIVVANRPQRHSFINEFKKLTGEDFSMAMFNDPKLQAQYMPSIRQAMRITDNFITDRISGAKFTATSGNDAGQKNAVVRMLMNNFVQFRATMSGRMIDSINTIYNFNNLKFWRSADEKAFQREQSEATTTKDKLDALATLGETAGANMIYAMTTQAGINLLLDSIMNGLTGAEDDKEWDDYLKKGIQYGLLENLLVFTPLGKVNSIYYGLASFLGEGIYEYIEKNVSGEKKDENIAKEQLNRLRSSQNFISEFGGLMNYPIKGVFGLAEVATGEDNKIKVGSDGELSDGYMDVFQSMYVVFGMPFSKEMRAYTNRAWRAKEKSKSKPRPQPKSLLD